MSSEFEMHTITMYAETDINAYICKFYVIQICHLRKKPPPSKHQDILTRSIFYKPMLVCTNYIYLH